MNSSNKINKIRFINNKDLYLIIDFNNPNTRISL